ncbi:hypothetical protein GCM10023212_01590 [Luteolibacter yonseiensis]
MTKKEGGLPLREWENLIIRRLKVKRESVFLILTANVPRAPHQRAGESEETRHSPGFLTGESESGTDPSGGADGFTRMVTEDET